MNASNIAAFVPYGPTHTYNWGFADWGDYNSHPHLISALPSQPHRSTIPECLLQHVWLVHMHIIPQWMRKRRAFKIISWLLNDEITWLAGLVGSHGMLKSELQVYSQMGNVFIANAVYHAVVERCTDKSRDCDSVHHVSSRMWTYCWCCALAHQPPLRGVTTFGAAVNVWEGRRPPLRTLIIS